MLTQRFTALHLALVAIMTLLITIAILRSPPVHNRAAPTTAVNLVPVPTEADTLPTIPVYQRDGTQGLTPEPASELELIMQWRVIDSETEALIPQAVTRIEVITAEGTEELTIEGAELEFTVPVGAVIRWQPSASGYVEPEEWNEFKAKPGSGGTMTGDIRLVPLGEQA